jgi:XTP/dITP diphosphohydrolase
MRVLLATRSDGKLAELRPLFAAASIEVLDLRDAGIAPRDDEEAIEAAETFEGNALLKARYFHALTGLPAVADDSGLAVYALDGAPGVRSKRWSGDTSLRGQALDDANNALLLRKLEGAADRRARYVCVAVYAEARFEVVARGESEGIIVTTPRGSGGFGYDPYFHSLELDRTFAEVSVAEKSGVSHRGRAFATLIARVRERIASRG